MPPPRRSTLSYKDHLAFKRWSDKINFVWDIEPIVVATKPVAVAADPVAESKRHPKYSNFVEPTKSIDDCGEAFKRHMGEGKVVSDSTGNFCKIGNCIKSYLNKCHLSRHVSEIHTRRRFKCKKCDKEFKQSSQCREHIGNVHFD